MSPHTPCQTPNVITNEESINTLISSCQNNTPINAEGLTKSTQLQDDVGLTFFPKKEERKMIIIQEGRHKHENAIVS